MIDSPGVLDRPLEERNTIEMQAITALAHLNACVIYLMDLSPLCEYPIKQQVHLFQSLLPLFKNKPVVVVCNKTDLRTYDQLTNEEQNLIQSITKIHPSVVIHHMSNQTKDGKL